MSRAVLEDQLCELVATIDRYKALPKSLARKERMAKLPAMKAQIAALKSQLGIDSLADIPDHEARCAALIAEQADQDEIDG